MFIKREEFLEAIEKVEKDIYESKLWKDDLALQRGVILGFEKLKHELGYDKMISRKYSRNIRESD